MFITFEGPDGAGKTTLIAALGQKLADALHKGVTGVSLPTDTMRGFLRANPSLAPWGEVLFHFADMVQVYTQVIQPALCKGQIVLCDRYSDSAIAYQGYGHGYNISGIEEMKSTVMHDQKSPDLTILLMAEAEDLRERIAQRGLVTGYDNATLEFKQRVYDGYEVLAKKNPKRFYRIGATLPFDVVLEQAFNAILSEAK